MNKGFFTRFINIFKSRGGEDDQSYLDNILNEYKQKRSSYEEFRNVMHNTIESLLQEGEYKYQISSRTKTLERLKGKVIRKKMDGRYYNNLNEIEDLVGVRVIFYAEREKASFINKIKKELSGVVKTEGKKKQNGYNATHMIVSFGQKRLDLSEYRKFKNLKSEIQVTSIFHHAWAEIEHDLIYKDVYKIKEANPEKYILVRDKMNQLSERYISKATEELEKIMYIIDK